MAQCLAKGLSLGPPARMMAATCCCSCLGVSRAGRAAVERSPCKTRSPLVACLRGDTYEGGCGLDVSVCGRGAVFLHSQCSCCSAMLGESGRVCKCGVRANDDGWEIGQKRLFSDTDSAHLLAGISSAADCAIFSATLRVCACRRNGLARGQRRVGRGAWNALVREASQPYIPFSRRPPELTAAASAVLRCSWLACAPCLDRAGCSSLSSPEGLEPMRPRYACSRCSCCCCRLRRRPVCVRHGAVPPKRLGMMAPHPVGPPKVSKAIIGTRLCGCGGREPGEKGAMVRRREGRWPRRQTPLPRCRGYGNGALQCLLCNAKSSWWSLKVMQTWAVVGLARSWWPRIAGTGQLSFLRGSLLHQFAGRSTLKPPGEAPRRGAKLFGMQGDILAFCKSALTRLKPTWPWDVRVTGLTKCKGVKGGWRVPTS